MEKESNRRRRPFLAGSLIAGVAALAVGAFAFAHGMGFHGMHGGMDPEEIADHIQVHVDHMLASVNASDEQKSKIQEIVKSAEKNLMALHEKAGSAHAELHDILTAQTVDRTRLEALRVRHVALIEEASKVCSTALADVADVLTPEQRAGLAKQMEKRHEGFSHGDH